MQAGYCACALSMDRETSQPDLMRRHLICSIVMTRRLLSCILSMFPTCVHYENYLIYRSNGNDSPCNVKLGARFLLSRARLSLWLRNVLVVRPNPRWTGLSHSVRCTENQQEE
jgi:hypothetical protein